MCPVTKEILDQDEKGDDTKDDVRYEESLAVL
jgi:hypothetical protein